MPLTKSVINIAAEATAAGFLLLLLAACLMQKRKDSTMRALFALALTDILILLCQIGQWTILGKISGGHSELLPIEKALFAADFSLICLLSALFRAYILAHRENLRAEAGLRREDHNREVHYISLWSVFVSAVFVSSIWTGAFYTFDANGYGKATLLYGVIFVAALLPTVLNTITTLKNRKLFGVKDTCFLMAFLVVPTVGIAIDLLFDLSFGYLFSPNGGPISPDSTRRMLHRVLDRAGLPHIRFHDLRHTFATLALQNGVDPKTLSGMLGHFSAGFTLDTYAHVTTQGQRAAANTMGSVVPTV